MGHESPLMTVQELARLTWKGTGSIKTRENVIRRQCVRGTIPATKIGRQWYMSRDEVLGPLAKGEGCNK